MKTIKITKEYKPPHFKNRPYTLSGAEYRCGVCKKGHRCKFHQSNGVIRQ